ncbi:MAG: universal stress protein [Planctomycetota bacterium]|jgi:nucleotide-binding universal stress UspA family protein
MRLLERILVATDLSQAADDAVKMAAYLARAFESEVWPIYVMPPLPEVAVPSDLVKDQVAKYLEALRQKLADEGAQVGEPIFATGEPFVKVIDSAEEHDVNVIVVGSGDKTDDDQYRMGITAERLERTAERPVLVVKRGAAPPIQRIVCPVDFSDTSGRALGEAIHLARSLDSRLSVLTVVEPLKGVLPRIVSVSEERQQAYVDAQTKEFERFVAGLDFHGVEHDKVVCQGKPHEEILAFVRDEQPDLLVMGSVGRTGLARALLGSVAEKVARELPCSIMTVKGEDFIRLQLRDEIEDIREHVERAEKLLKKGFAQEALGELRHCIARDPMYAPAWEGAAAVYERLGNQTKAGQCRKRSEEIIRSLWDRRIEAEIRSQHVLWRK